MSGGTTKEDAMGRLVTVTSQELAVGYRLAGVTTRAASSPEEAAAEIRALVDAGERGLIAVHAPFWSGLDRSLRRELETRQVPLVVPLPAAGAAELAAERRRELQAMVARAVGYEFTFDPEAGSP
jgi:vacuolar-type H+-ATPase subunit F/Vma7